MVLLNSRKSYKKYICHNLWKTMHNYLIGETNGSNILWNHYEASVSYQADTNPEERLKLILSKYKSYILSNEKFD